MDDYVRNAWYPATWSRDIARELTARRILGQDVVLYRTGAGAVAALEDVCPHRLTPLSMGRLRGDSIECGYHGMTFDCRGECVRIPGQEIIPRNAKVRSYPVVENMGLAWIWMGDPALAKASRSMICRNFMMPHGARSKATRCGLTAIISASPTISAIPRMSASSISRRSATPRARMSRCITRGRARTRW